MPKDRTPAHSGAHEVGTSPPDGTSVIIDETLELTTPSGKFLLKAQQKNLT